MDSHSPIRPRTGFMGMTPVKQGFTGQAETGETPVLRGLGKLFIIYILDLWYNILEGESSPVRGEGMV